MKPPDAEVSAPMPPTGSAASQVSSGARLMPIDQRRETSQDMVRIQQMHRRLDALQFPSDQCARSRTHLGNDMGLGNALLGAMENIAGCLRSNITYVPALGSLSRWTLNSSLCGTETSILCFMDLTSCRVEHVADLGSPVTAKQIAALPQASRIAYTRVQEQFPWPQMAGTWVKHPQMTVTSGDRCGCDAEKSAIISWIFNQIDCATLRRVDSIRKSAVRSLTSLKQAGHRVIGMHVRRGDSCHDSRRADCKEVAEFFEWSKYVHPPPALLPRSCGMYGRSQATPSVRQALESSVQCFRDLPGH